MSAATKRDLLEMLSVVADHASRLASYRGRGDAPAYQWACERTANPRIGDLVIEITHINWTSDCVGWLESITEEPMYDASEWNVAVDGPIPTQTVWTLRRLTGGAVRWSNCRFAAVPKDTISAVTWGEDVPAAIAWHEDFAARNARTRLPDPIAPVSEERLARYVG